MNEWITKKRKELEDQKKGYLANVTAIQGAIQLLDQMEKDGLSVMPPGQVQAEIVEDKKKRG
jgi:hypothetical protein